jgi:hypothetical protein
MEQDIGLISFFKVEALQKVSGIDDKSSNSIFYFSVQGNYLNF